MPRGDIQIALRAKRGDVHLIDVMRVAKRATEIGIRTAIPARILTYNPTTQKAKVIAEHIVVLNDDFGESELAPMTLEAIPVRWPAAGAGTSYMTFPLVPGDTGHIVISDRSLERWMTTNKPVDPALRHTHNPIDGIFEPGLHADAKPLAATDMTAAVLESGALVKIGAGAQAPANFVALAQALHTYLTALFAAGVPVAMDGGAALQTAWKAYLAANPFTDFSSTKGMVE